MSVPKAVRGWVADAEDLVGPTFDVWFPEAFDWRAFCSDVPRMVERLGARWTGPNAPAARARLEDVAGAAFRGSYVATLALLSGYDRGADPEDAFDALTRPLSDAEAEGFERAVEEDLGGAEEAMSAGEGGAGGGDVSEGAREAARTAAIVGPTVRALLAEGMEGAARSLASLSVPMEPAAKVLAGVVNVGIAVAALRYAVASTVAKEEGRAPLAYDPVAMRAALGA